MYIFQDVKKTLACPTVPDLRRKVPETFHHHLMERRRNLTNLEKRVDELEVGRKRNYIFIKLCKEMREDTEK